MQQFMVYSIQLITQINERSTSHWALTFHMIEHKMLRSVQVYAEFQITFYLIEI